MSNPKKTLEAIYKKLTTGLKREPQEFIYINQAALHEHFKATTGMNRVPISFSESIDASAGVKMFGFQIGTSGGEATSFNLSEPHMFEALEPHLREKYPELKCEEDVISTLQGFGWLQGGFYGITSRTKGSIQEWDTEYNKYVRKERITYRKYYGLDVKSHMVTILCDTQWFSPFYRFLSTDTDIYQYDLKVEILGYNSGVVNFDRFSTGRSLVFVPTIILYRDERTKKAMADMIKAKNKGELSSMFGLSKSTRDRLMGHPND